MTLSDQQIERWARQIILPEVGGRGQARLLGATAFVAGRGGAAHFARELLERAGLRTDGDAPADVFVDFSGNGGLVRAVHARLGDALKESIAVGLTHWERMTPASDLPGPTPAFFFAPDRVKKRMEDWGAAEFQRRLGDAMGRFLASTSGWLRVVEGQGAHSRSGLRVRGRAPPGEGRRDGLGEGRHGARPYARGAPAVSAGVRTRPGWLRVGQRFVRVRSRTALRSNRRST